MFIKIIVLPKRLRPVNAVIGTLYTHAKSQTAALTFAVPRFLLINSRRFKNIAFNKEKIRGTQIFSKDVERK
jgi:hypothetical protein